jgi:folate receptor
MSPSARSTNTRPAAPRIPYQSASPVTSFSQPLGLICNLHLTTESDPRPATSSLRIDDNGKLYSDYDLAACGISSGCKKYFIEESCFYECDRNVGKWRKHAECDGGNNGWEISNMPIKASYWDAWYEACKDDYFAWGEGGYWDLPKYTADAYKGAGAAGTNTAYTSCTKFGGTYKNGKEVAEVMWGGSFTYETDEAKGYVMAFTDGQANPNNAIFADKAYPTMCPGQEVNITHPGFDTDGKTRLSFSELSCPVDWHLEVSSGVNYSPAAMVRAPFVAIMGVVFAALAVIM